jgi:hypothetical protein
MSSIYDQTYHGLRRGNTVWVTTYTLAMQLRQVDLRKDSRGRGKQVESVLSRCYPYWYSTDLPEA